jgi:hypothetical protein
MIVGAGPINSQRGTSPDQDKSPPRAGPIAQEAIPGVSVRTRTDRRGLRFGTRLGRDDPTARWRATTNEIVIMFVGAGPLSAVRESPTVPYHQRGDHQPIGFGRCPVWPCSA